jgi:hypothetical protein
MTHPPLCPLPAHVIGHAVVFSAWTRRAGPEVVDLLKMLVRWAAGQTVVVWLVPCPLAEAT